MLTGDIELLPKLFERVLVPQVVRDELANAEAPGAVRDWIAQTPAGLTCGRLIRASTMLPHTFCATQRHNLPICHSGESWARRKPYRWPTRRWSACSCHW